MEPEGVAILLIIGIWLGCGIILGYRFYKKYWVKDQIEVEVQ